MTFGLWFEPEMVNPDSDLYRAHPDWVLGPADQITGRNQMVLNLALPQVRDNLFHQVSAILTEYPIDYVKWDHNRLLPVVDVAQTRGIYDLLARLRAAHPDGRDRKLRQRRRPDRLRHPGPHPPRLAVRQQRRAGTPAHPARRRPVPARRRHRQPCRPAPLPHLGPGPAHGLPRLGRRPAPHGVRDGPARTDGR